MADYNLLKELNSSRNHQFNMANALDATPIEDWSSVPMETYFDWVEVIKRNDGEGGFHNFLNSKTRHEIIEKIKKYEKLHF